MIHHRTYPLFTFDLNLGIKVTQNVAQYNQHHVTDASAMFEVVTSNSLDSFAPPNKMVARAVDLKDIFS